MRIRFAGYLAMGIVSAFLIVASYAFVAGTFWWIALIGGIALAVLGAFEVADARRRVVVAEAVAPTASRARAWLVAPAAVTALIGVAMAVIALAASAAVAADWAFGLAIAAGALSALGLTEHELIAERDVRRPRMPAAY